MAFGMAGPVRCLPPVVEATSIPHAPPVISKEVSEIVNNMLSVAIPAAAAASAQDQRFASQFRCGPEFATMKAQALEACRKILAENDQGGYTIPAKGLYPYQWNWDSALVSLGLAEMEEERAWEELDRLMSAQWEDGMVPHIVFHKPSSTYFPGPEIWGSPDKPRNSTGITQPPVAAISVRRLLEEAKDKALALAMARKLFPKLLAWHRWFYRARDPEGTGLVATIHPWETGMDNSPAWDEALARVPIDDIPPYVRRDLGHVDAKMRPQKAEYDRYLTLLYRFRALDYDEAKLYYETPFRVTDLCTNCILHKANEDLLWLAGATGACTDESEIRGWTARANVAFDTLFDVEAGLYRCKDQLTGQFLPAATSAGFLPLFAGVASGEKASAVARTLGRWLDDVAYGIPSCDPRDPWFEALRYWRGPVWLIVNWMVSEGLKRYGYGELAQRVERDSYELVKNGGIFEYYCPLTGMGAGGGCFSWTAAMCLAWLFKS
ncbi:uncharacterized protein LOC9630789 [Selaginella moellendorffii]|nr:uncharacterized protein LOC9630789 [Selaginella moellendorffii]XP_024519840.1 uncharacterized protein LOC9630789 [Selaginella moellendorffii]XP_024519841.1 uncharacterized protein LOC9630789 [Selaginella moellendorffii]|eukprot:XP_002990235.2 uncharacterized protein LOC9630789 [Selaginella moellendorffii]